MLSLADTNLKNLNHDYRVLTGCNQLEYLNLMDNNLEMLCFEQFPALPRLTELNIRNNSLINLDVLELKKKFQNLSEIIMTGNDWSCNFYVEALKPHLKESRIIDKSLDGFLNEAVCLHGSVAVEMKICPKIERNLKYNKQGEDQFWIFILLNCVTFITDMILLRSYIVIFQSQI
jgi:hypothetical protein